jgi:hypothetical protein
VALLHPPLGGGRGDVDDLPSATFDHVGKDGTRDGPRGAEVDVLDAVPLGQGHLGRRADEVHPGAVYEDIYATLKGEDVVHPRFGPGDLGDVQVDRTSSDLLGNLPRAFSSMSAQITRAPWAAKTRAVAAPVTSATLPFSSKLDPFSVNCPPLPEKQYQPHPESALLHRDSPTSGQLPAARRALQ